VKNGKRLSRLPVDVSEALQAIATTGKGRCWYCDLRLPAAEAAIRGGWDVQRVEELPVASIILVCPDCRRRERVPAPCGVDPPEHRAPAVRMHTAVQRRNGGGRRVMALEPKRA